MTIRTQAVNVVTHDQPAWPTESEIKFLELLASAPIIGFGKNHHSGYARVVDTGRALRGYAASFRSRTNWGAIDRAAIHAWLERHGYKP